MFSFVFLYYHCTALFLFYFVWWGWYNRVFLNVLLCVYKNKHISGENYDPGAMLRLQHSASNNLTHCVPLETGDSSKISNKRKYLIILFILLILFEFLQQYPLPVDCFLLFEKVFEYFSSVDCFCMLRIEHEGTFITNVKILWRKTQKDPCTPYSVYPYIIKSP